MNTNEKNLIIAHYLIDKLVDAVEMHAYELDHLIKSIKQLEEDAGHTEEFGVKSPWMNKSVSATQDYMHDLVTALYDIRELIQDKPQE